MVCVFLLAIWRESTQYSSDLTFWDKGIEISVLKEMQELLEILMFAMFLTGFNLKIWLRTSIVL